MIKLTIELGGWDFFIYIYIYIYIYIKYMNQEMIQPLYISTTLLKIKNLE